MELLKALPYDGFRAVELALKQHPRIYLDVFTEAVTDACRVHGVDHDALTRRAIQAIFHQIDFHDKGFVTWEQVTMHMIEDTMRIMIKQGSDSGTDNGPSRSELTSLDNVGASKQTGARVRMLRYVDAWDRMLRVVNTSQESYIEMTSVGSVDHVSKVSRAMLSPIVALEAIADHSIVVAAHSDMSCSFHGAQVLREGPAVTSMALHRVVPRRETEESTTAFLWHPQNKVLYSAFRGGSIASWNLKLERSLLTERYLLQERTQVFDQPISALLPFEDKLVVSSVVSNSNIGLYDPTRNVLLETLKGHQLGVTCLASVDTTGMIVSGGFEQTPFVWLLKIRDYPPWKLIDKAEPHKGCIQSIVVPSLSNKVLTSDDRGVVKLWDLRTCKCVQTMYGDQPPPPKPHQQQHNTATPANHFHAVAFQASGQLVLSCGPQHIHRFRGNVPSHMNRTDDTNVAALLYHSTNAAIYTAHGCTVKVWCQKAGAVLSQYNNITRSPITAMSFDNRGRKFFVGCANGDVRGFSVMTGTCFRTFRSVEGEVRSLSYGTLRNGGRCLLGATATEMFCYDDTTTDGRQQVLVHPLQHIRLQITKTVDDPVEAERRSRLATYRGVVVQSKLSIAFVWARWFVVGIDLYSLAVAHHFDADGGEIIAVCSLGDLPAVAVLDHRNILYVYAIRPSLAAGTLLTRRDLSDVNTSSGTTADAKGLDKRTRHSIAKARRMSLKRLSEERFMNDVVAEFVPHDETAPAGMFGCIMRFHQGKRSLFISDANGMLWEWSVEAFIKRSGLTSMYYPLQSLTEQVLRRPNVVVDDASGENGIHMSRVFSARDEEIRFFEIIFHNSATRLLVGGADNSVTLWTPAGEPLGELSQGRFLHPGLVGDRVALTLLYERHGVLPWRFSDAPQDDDIKILDDVPQRVLNSLRKVAARFRGRHRQFKRREQSSPTSPERADGVASFATEMSTSQPVAEERVMVHSTLTDVVAERPGTGDEPEMGSTRTPLSALWLAHDDDKTDTKSAVQDRRVQIVPKAKFKVRGAVVQKSSANVPPLIMGVLNSPRRHEQPSISQRSDMHLTRSGLSAQAEAREEAHDRLMHISFGKVMNCKSASQTVLLDLPGATEAQQMRRVFVPQIPYAVKPPSRPSGGLRQGRVPLSARDQERFAVARLLGEMPGNQAMDDFCLPREQHDGVL